MKNFKTTIATLFMSVVIVMNCFSQAQNYFGYFPTTGLQYGYGFDINNPTKLRLPFLNVTASDIQNAAGATNFSLYLIQDISTLRQSTQADAYLCASYLGNSLSASYNLNQELFFNQNSITLAINAKSDFGTERIKSYKLNDDAQQLITAKDYNTFLKRYGDHYVIGVSKGLSVTLYLTILNISSESKKKIQSGVTFSGGSATFSVDAIATFSSELQKTNSSDKLVIQIASNGDPNGFKDLGDIVRKSSTKEGAFDSIKNAFADYMEKFDKKNAQVTGFFYSSMDDFGVDATYNLLEQNKVKKLTALYDFYKDIEARSNLLDNITKSEYYKDYHTKNDSIEAKKLSRKFQMEMDSLSVLHKQCLINPCSNISTCCNKPDFDFSSDLIDKFTSFPFNECISSNDLYAFQYANHKFTFESSADRNFSKGQNLFYCESVNPYLANKKVSIRVSGTVYNDGGQNWNHSYGCSLKFLVNNKETNAFSSTDGAGDKGFTLQADNIVVGSDGKIIIQVLDEKNWWHVNDTWLTLRKGARVEISIEK